VIASITRGKDAGALGVYLHGSGRHNEHAYNARVAGMVIAGSIPVTDPTKSGQWVANMRRAYRGRDDVARPVWQCSLRTAPEDRRLSDAEWADAAQVFAERLGFDQHPWVAVRHADDHIHLALSRVAHDGRVWFGRHDYRATQDARQELEVELGLVQAPLRRGVSSPRTEVTQVRAGEFRMYEEAGRRAPRVALAGQVLAAANTAAGRGREVFEAELADRGIDFAVNQASTGTVSGYRFAAPVTAHADQNGEQVWFKASQLDKKLAWRVLSQVLEPLPVVDTEKDFTTRREADNDRHWYQVGRAELEQDWIKAGNPRVDFIQEALRQDRARLAVMTPTVTAATATARAEVSVALEAVYEARWVWEHAGRLRRGGAQERYDKLAAQHSDRLGVAVTDRGGSMRPYDTVLGEVLTARHGGLLTDHARWTQEVRTAETQLSQWSKLEADFESGQQARRDYQQWHQKFSMHAIGDAARAYREHLTALPQPKAYPEGEPDPVGAQLLGHLAEPERHAARAQRLADNLTDLSDYQRRATPPSPPAPRRAPTKRPRASGAAPTVQPTRNQNRGYGR